MLDNHEPKLDSVGKYQMPLYANSQLSTYISPVVSEIMHSTSRLWINFVQRTGNSMNRVKNRAKISLCLTN
jgi:hypothetical protein